MAVGSQGLQLRLLFATLRSSGTGRSSGKGFGLGTLGRLAVGGFFPLWPISAIPNYEQKPSPRQERCLLVIRILFLVLPLVLGRQFLVDFLFFLVESGPSLTDEHVDLGVMQTGLFFPQFWPHLLSEKHEAIERTLDSIRSW